MQADDTSDTLTLTVDEKKGKDAKLLTLSVVQSISHSGTVEIW